MSQLKKLPAPKRWTPAARGWIVACGGVKCAAKLVEVKSCTLSQWHNGNARPTADRVKQIITLALGSGVCLTPADLGRPDLVGKGGQP
jgi:DNA-binding transcriptional regulator YdaS (Cro superfamily)